MASDEQPAAPSISQHLDELTKGIKELQHLDQLKKCIRELERKGEEAEKRIKELERKGEEAEKRNKEHKGDETETKPKEASIQRATQNADLSTWKSHVTFERRLLDVNAGTYKTETMEATEDIDDALGGLFRGAAEKSIRILLNQEEQSVDLHIEKMKKDSWLFDTFLKEIPDLQRYQNVQVGNASIRLRPPYAPLYHNKELLQKISAELKPLDQKKKEQLDALLRLFEYDWLKKYHDGNMYHDGNIDHTVKFSELWRIYKPGSLVVVSALRKHQVVRKIVSSHTPGEDDSPQEFAVVCTEISHDGKEFGEREVAVIQDAFSGSKRVADLEARPLDLYPAAQKKEIRKNLIKRGEYWYKIYAKPEVKVMSYRGNCVSLSKILEAFRNDRVAEFQGMHSVSRIEGETFMSQLSGRVIIDPDAPIKAPPIFSRLYSLIKGRPDIVWNDNVKDQYLRSPALIPVFSLDVDQWVLAAVEKLQPPKWQDIWGQLIYPDTDKDKFERLKKMVENHRTFLEEQKEEQKHGKGDTGDFIPEKGNGLVILLSGPSGLGKTLTAECLEHSTKKPLYRINLGRFSGKGKNSNENLEGEIERIFVNARAWDTILLIDEAEAIMLERTPDNIDLNSWVSVFLRKLEYYEGIIVLTTNLIHLMDPAFQSRVKFAIRFENMTQPIRGTIWKNILVRSTPENSVNRPARDALVRQAEKEWSRKEKYNGRHIRNVVWNARVLTHPDEEKKLLEAIDEVLKDTDSFIDQIEKAKKEEDDKLLQGW